MSDREDWIRSRSEAWSEDYGVSLIEAVRQAEKEWDAKQEKERCDDS